MPSSGSKKNQLVFILISILAVFQIFMTKRISTDAVKSTNTNTNTNTITINKAVYGIKSPHNDKESLKVMLYITTHMSPQHVWYLKSCWLPALQNSVLLRTSDVVVYLNPTKNDTTKLLEEAKQLLKGTFSNQNLTIHHRSNPGYQEGAKAAISDAVREGWFHGYDWVIRMNPDVIIRDDTLMLDIIQNDPNATAILLNCISSNSRPIVHTDFFAIKPGALGTAADNVLNSTTTAISIDNAERSFTKSISADILEKGNHRWIEAASPRNGMCRAGSGKEMDQTHITHFHVEENYLLNNNFTCPIPF